MPVSRVLSGLALALGSLALGSVASAQSAQSAQPAPTSAQAPQQVPGYYQQTIGALQVTALFDGVVRLPRAQVKGLAPAQVDALLKGRYVPESAEGLQTAVNAYLLQVGGRRVLIDAGTADCFGPGLGQVVANLKAAGTDPALIDDVLLTHAHPDHLCGVLGTDGARAFPNATVWIDGTERAYWQGPQAEARTPQAFQFIIPPTRRALAAYADAGKLRSFGPGDALPGGVQALPSPGHTPGHTSYLIDGGNGQQLLVWGDVVHYHVVQFARPSASYEPDADRARAIASRRSLLAQAAGKGWWVAGAHLPFPGLGHVRREGQGYAWVPAEFSPVAAVR